jgi:hypothetical protein
VRDNLRTTQQLRAELEAMPLWRATRTTMDLAFVPYSHLKRVSEGHVVYACEWLLFACRHIGSVGQIFRGEVVTEDPWRTLARGQYVELKLDDHAALKERSLRVREPTTHLIDSLMGITTAANAIAE